MRVKQASYGCKISSACGHSPPFSQALTAALHVIVSIWMLLRAMTPVTLTSDMLQCPTVTLSAHAPWAAPEKMQVVCIAIFNIRYVCGLKNIKTLSIVWRFWAFCFIIWSFYSLSFSHVLTTTLQLQRTYQAYEAFIDTFTFVHATFLLCSE